MVEARALYPSHSLAQLYRADSMPTELTAAHHDLDDVLDAIFGLDQADRNHEGRQRALFTEFVRLDPGKIGNLP